MAQRRNCVPLGDLGKKASWKHTPRSKLKLAVCGVCFQLAILPAIFIDDARVLCLSFKHDGVWSLPASF